MLRLVDRPGKRELDVLVTRGFDRAVGVLCCSAALCADVPGCAGPGVGLVRRWPGLAGHAREVLDRPPPAG